MVYAPLTLVGDYHLESSWPGAAGMQRSIAVPMRPFRTRPGLTRTLMGNRAPVDGNPAAAVTIVADIGADEVSARRQRQRRAAAGVRRPRRPSRWPTLASRASTRPSRWIRTARRLRTAVICRRNFFQNCDSTVSISRCRPDDLHADADRRWSTPITITAAISPPNTAANRATQPICAESCCLPNAAPTANNDQFNVSSNGTFSVPAPGVLGNDSAGPLLGAMSAELVTNLRPEERSRWRPVVR